MKSLFDDAYKRTSFVFVTFLSRKVLVICFPNVLLKGFFNTEKKTDVTPRTSFLFSYYIWIVSVYITLYAIPDVIELGLTQMKQNHLSKARAYRIFTSNRKFQQKHKRFAHASEINLQTLKIRI